MRGFLPLALAALAGFGAGFGGARCLQEGARVAEESTAASPSDTAPADTPIKAAVSPVALKEGIAAVLALGEKYRDLAEDHALFLAISKLEGSDFLAGADGMLTLLKKTERPFGTQSTALAEAWMERWLELDSAGAWRFLESSPFLQELPAGAFFYALAIRADMPLGGIFKALVRRTPDQLREYLAALKPSPMREIGTYLLVNETAQQDPAKAKLLFASLGEGGNRPAALRGYITGLAESDRSPTSATGLPSDRPVESGTQSDAPAGKGEEARMGRVFSALQEPVALRKRFALFEAVRGLTAQDLPALVSRADGLPVSKRDELLPPLVERWFALDFDGAQDWMRAHPQEFSLFKVWAQTNPDAAIQQALAHPDEDRSITLLIEATKKLAGGDARAQFDKLKTLPKKQTARQRAQ